MSDKPTSFALLVPVDKAQTIRCEMEFHNILDTQCRLQKFDQYVAVPVLNGHEAKVKQLWQEYQIKDICLPLSRKENVKASSPSIMLRKRISTELKRHNLDETLLTELPTKWKRHGDLILLHSDSFKSSQWKILGQPLWKIVAAVLSCKRLAKSSTISQDGFRSPQVELLLGDDGWVTHVDNNIKYSFDVTKCMFSPGNITEKLRVANFDCRHRTVVDLYAGIGYFTLPYLVHAKADHVHACEWNPASVSALRRNLEDNCVQDRCTIHEGDNRQLKLMSVADVVNLGLIPSSEPGWPIGAQVLKTSGGTVLVHGTVSCPPESAQCGNSSEAPGRCSNQGSDALLDSSDNDNVELLRIVPSKTHSPERDSSHCIPKTLVPGDNTVTNKANLQICCDQWSLYVQQEMKRLLQEKTCDEWTVNILHLEFVKSYAPHVWHVVLDLDCHPSHHNKQL